MPNYKVIDRCRLCESGQMEVVLKFDEQYIASTFVKSNDGNPLAKVKVPLTLLLCRGCGLVQLRETVNADLLYRNYFYRTGINDTMRRDLREVVDQAQKHTNLSTGDYVVDVGANDCTMISMFPAGLNRVAVEPARNIAWDHVDHSIIILNDYFSKEIVLGATAGKPVKALTATAMFYDLDDPNRACSDIKAILAPDGVCVIQVSYLYYTIRDMNFYDICHEHLEYYSLATIGRLMERNGLEVYDASTNSVNGGSLRVFVQHKGRGKPSTESCQRILAEEGQFRLDDSQTYTRYGASIKNLIERSRAFILSQIENGELVIGLGASTKGNVLLQLLGITKDVIPYISERNPEKVGLRTVGTDIELISEDAARRHKPSCMLVIPWNFKDEIVAREREYLQQGGKLLFLMPRPYYIDAHGETALA